MNIGENIALARDLRQLSQADLAKAADISQVQMSRIESGDIKNPSFKDISKIGAALNISLQTLAIGGDYLIEYAVSTRLQDHGVIVGLTEDYKEPLLLHHRPVAHACVLGESELLPKVLISRTARAGLNTKVIGGSTYLNRLTEEDILREVKGKGDTLFASDSATEILGNLLEYLGKNKTDANRIAGTAVADKLVGQDLIKYLGTHGINDDIKELVSTQFRLEDNYLWKANGVIETLARLHYTVLNSDEDTVVFVDIEEVSSDEDMLWLERIVDSAELRGVSLRFISGKSPEERLLERCFYKVVSRTDTRGLPEAVQTLGSREALLISGEKENLNWINYSELSESDQALI